MIRACGTRQSRGFTGTVVILVVAVLAAIAQDGKSSPDDAGTSVTIIYDAFGGNADFEKDWGFAAILHHEGRNILIDTGNDPEIFARNAKRANVDLSQIDAVVLTHRHMDHLGGLPVVLASNPDVPVYAPEEAFSAFGSKLASSFYHKEDSLPPSMRFYAGEPARELHFASAWPGADITTVSGREEIFPGVYVLASQTSSGDSAGIVELSLFVETPQGLLVVVGCSHPGVADIVANVQGPEDSVALLVGGFHMPRASLELVDQTSQRLKQLGVLTVAPAHCTGEPAIARFREQWAGRFITTGVGRRIAMTELPHTVNNHSNY